MDREVSEVYVLWSHGLLSIRHDIDCPIKINYKQSMITVIQNSTYPCVRLMALCIIVVSTTNLNNNIIHNTSKLYRLNGPTKTHSYLSTAGRCISLS